MFASGVPLLPGSRAPVADGNQGSSRPQTYGNVLDSPQSARGWRRQHYPTPEYLDSERSVLEQFRRPDLSYPRAAFNNQCNDSDGLNFCECQLNRGNVEKCMYYGRHVEPLAFSLDQLPIMRQNNCPLFARAPLEIRELIYEYALTDTTSNPPISDRPYRDNPNQREDGHDRSSLPHSDIAMGLLQTCRAIYLETYQLPLLLNPFIVYKFGNLPSYDICRPRFVGIAPWQFALIQRLDISLQQIALEGDKLSRYLRIWRAKERSQGAVIAPRFYQESRSTYRNAMLQSFNFGVLPRKGHLEDGMKVNLPYKSSLYSHQIYPTLSSARVMVARPLTHLTLRLSRTDWWTWDDLPTEDPMRHLGLDPALGNGGGSNEARPTAPIMLQHAAERRLGQWPRATQDNGRERRYTTGWGAEIAKLVDLRVLELVLETFEDRRNQLDTVLECAKSWEFPLDDMRHTLVCRDKVESHNYIGEGVVRSPHRSRHTWGPVESPTPAPSRYDVRRIRYRRIRVQQQHTY